MYNRLKTFILTFLIVLAIYQMFKFWFDDYSSRNFLYSILSSPFSEKKVVIDDEYRLKPNSIILTFGDDNYITIKNTRREYKDIELEIEGIYNKILYDGVVEKQDKKSELKFLETKSILIDYEINDLMLGHIRRIPERAEAKNDVIGKFNKVAFVIDEDNGKVKCYFIDDKSKSMKLVNIDYDLTEIQRYIKTISDNISMYKYSLTEHNEYFNMFRNDVFITTLKSKPIVNQNLVFSNPFIYDDIINEELIEKYVDSFFKNPLNKWKLKNEGNIILYGDGLTNVKVDLNGIIEYEYPVNKKEGNIVSFNDAYQIAKKFIEKDSEYVFNELYLDSIKKTDDNRWEMKFKIRIDNIPYVISNNVMKDYNLNSPVEISVEGDRVVYYKKLIREFKITPSFESKKLVTYEEVLKKLQKDSIIEGKIDDMYLSYYQDELNKSPVYKWILETTSKTYVIDAISE